MEVSKGTLQSILEDLESALEHTESKLSDDQNYGYPYGYGYLQSTIKSKIFSISYLLNSNEV